MDNTVPQHAPKDTSANQQVILVVDARPMRQFYTSIFLQRLNYQVIMAKTAEDAVLFLGLTVPLVIIANHDLPQMTGLELLTRVRRDPRTRGVPFIIYTSNRSPDVQQACEAAGCSGVPAPPCSLEDVYATVEATQKRPRRFLRLTTKLDVELEDGRSAESGRSDLITAISERGMFVSTLVPLSIGWSSHSPSTCRTHPDGPSGSRGRSCSATSARTSGRSGNGREIPEDRRPGARVRPGVHQAGAYGGDRPGAGQPQGPRRPVPECLGSGRPEGSSPSSELSD